MTSDTHSSSASARAGSSASTRGPAVPVWLIVVMFLLLYWGALFFDKHGGWFSPKVYQPYETYAQLESYNKLLRPPGSVDLQRGKQVFDTICALCHGVDGEGKPGQAPPLDGSEWAQGVPEHMIRIPLYGLTGPVTVKGQEYNLSMPAMGAALSPEDLAAVLSYIRSSWSNKASPVTPAQVSAIKTQVGTRSQPFTAGELNAIK